MTKDDAGQDQSPSMFGPLLKRLRITADLIQEELAERAGRAAAGSSERWRSTTRRRRRCGGMRRSGPGCGLFPGRLRAGCRSHGRRSGDLPALDDLDGAGSALGNLGLLADAAGDYPRATALYEEVLAIFRVLGDLTRTGYMLNNLGLIAHFQGDYDRAAGLHEEALNLRREQGDPDSIAYSLGNLGLVAYAQGDYARAEALQTETLILRRIHSSKSALARCYENIALIAAATREPDRAWETGAAMSPDEATACALERDRRGSGDDLAMEVGAR